MRIIEGWQPLSIFPLITLCIILTTTSANHATTESCLQAIDRIKRGPEMPYFGVEHGNGSKIYIDHDFYQQKQLYDGFTPIKKLESYNDQNGTFSPLSTAKSLHDLHFYGKHSKKPHWSDINQGNAATCYILSSVGALSQFPDLIQNIFVELGYHFYFVRFYVRGKPWIISIDDEMYHVNGSLYFAAIPKSKSLWVPLLEKAWAKLIGTYSSADHGYVVNGMRALTGLPIFDYKTEWLEEDEIWELLNESNTQGYLLVACTIQGDYSARNENGLQYSHAYTILESFQIRDENLVAHRLFMIRNPVGATQFNGVWSSNSTLWTQHAINQVPHGVKPNLAQETGTFFVDLDEFKRNFESFQIGHNREGYSDKIWHDVENDDGHLKEYFLAKNPSSNLEDGDIYVTVETYYPNQIASDCFSYGKSAPTLKMYVYINDIRIGYKYYADLYNRPFLIENWQIKRYMNGDEFPQIKIQIMYTWNSSPAKDYTIKLYQKGDLKILDAHGKSNQIFMDGREPSGFTNSTYDGKNVQKGWPKLSIEKADEKTVQNKKKLEQSEEESAHFETLSDLISHSKDFSEFCGHLFQNFWLIFRWF